MILGAVFDMDGLMFDTEKLTYTLQRKIMREFFGADFSLEQYKQTIGRRTADLPLFFKKLYGSDFDFDKFHKHCLTAFEDYTQNYGIPVKDGLFELLDELKRKNIKIALATSTTRKSAERALKIAGVLDYFDALICAEDVKNGKPDPEPFLKACRQLGIKPRECLALEDSFNGIRSAHGAGTVTVMVPDLIEPTYEIRKMCFEVCADLYEVKNLIQ